MKDPNARKWLSYLALARSAALSNVRRPKLPYKLTFSLTSRCNLRCRFCRTWQRGRDDELSLEEIREFFRRQPGFAWIDFTGGEISLRPDLKEILDAACRLPRLALLHFPTNGFLVERIVDVCVFAKSRAPGRFIVSVSLDGPPELHDRLRGRAESWKNAVDTYTALRRRGIEVFFGMTLHGENLALLDETRAAVEARMGNLPRDCFHFNLAHESFFYNNRGTAIPLPAGLNGIFAGLARGARSRLNPRRYLEYRYLALVPRYLASRRSPLPCLSFSSSCYIGPTGTVYPCSMYDRPLGELRETGFDLSAIWNSAAGLAARAGVAAGACPHCWTPCEAYQTILGNFLRRHRQGKRP